MPTRPIGQEQDKETLLGRCMPKTALGAGRLAFSISTVAMLIGLVLLITASILNHQQAVVQDDGSITGTLDEGVDYQGLNREWTGLRDTLLPPGSMVLPHSPQARALMWLALQSHDKQLATPSKNGLTLSLSERYALAVLYYHWAGWAWHLPEENGGWNLTWNPMDFQQANIRSECDWFGVTCSETVTGDVTVTKLNMTGGTYFFLRGTLPSELGLLSNMVDFSASDNQLYGSLPAELQAWTNLRFLSLRFNLLTELGDAYKSWTEMESLDIGENRFRGNISASALRSMRGIKTLSLINNRELYVDTPLFTEPINGPYWPVLQDLSISITQVEIDLSRFSGKTFPHLKTIDAGQATLAGSIPSTIGSLTQLEFLNLANPVSGQLSGSIPTEIGLLSDRLEFVSLDATGISGTLPNELGALTNTKTFSVYMNSLSGTIPTEVGDMKSLVEFNVAQNGFSGTVPTELGLCSNLMDLELHFTQLTGTMPQEICQLNDHIEEGFLKLGASCAITPETATSRQIVCSCCTDCYGT